MTPASPRHEDGQFASAYDDHALLLAAGEIVRHARRGQRRWIEQDDYDLARAPAGHPHAPTARQTCQRLRLTWKEVQLAYDHDQMPQLLRTSSGRQRPVAQSAASLNEVIQSLTTVARSANTRTLLRHEYRDQRSAILAADRRAWGHGGDAARHLLRLDQIDLALKPLDMTWENGLIAAGLEPAVRVSRVGRPLSMVEAYELFVAECGCLATRETVRAYVRRRGIQLTEKNEPEPRRRFVQARRSAGLPEVPRCSRDFEIPDDLPQGLDGVARAPKEWTYAVCVQGVAKALRALEGRRRLGQRELNRLAADDRDIPYYSGLHDVMRREKKPGGLPRAIRDAIALNGASAPSSSHGKLTG